MSTSIRNLRFQSAKRLCNRHDDKLHNNVPHIHEDVNITNLKQSQRNDVVAAKMIRYIEADDLPDDEKQARKLIFEAERYCLHEGALYHVWQTPAKRHMPEKTTVQLYIPSDYIDMILLANHDDLLAAHFGFHKTYAKIRQRYFWKGMHKDTDNWIRSCISCSRRKTPKHKVVEPLMKMTTVSTFERVSVDILGPLPISSSGNRYVLCFTDHCTRWPILVPTQSTDALTVASCFYKEIICNHGCPRFLLSDRGTNFLSKLMLEVCHIMKTNKLNTSAYHPQCNAVQERFNAVIFDTISHYVNKFHTDWDEYIPSIQFAYRTSTADNSVGFSPFFLLYGREAVPTIGCITTQTNRTSRKNNKRTHRPSCRPTRDFSRGFTKPPLKKQVAMKQRYDENATEVQYEVGDCVFIFFPKTQPGLSRKLQQRWCGPYLLVKRTGTTNFIVRNLENNKPLSSPIHVNRMKFAYDRYIRPSNDTVPIDLDARAPIQELNDNDFPTNSFQPKTFV